MKERTETYDLAVTGGGLAGMAAAIAAARQGLRVCLLEHRPVLGGNASTERRVPPEGAGRLHAFGRETGIAAEWAEEERRRNHTGWLPAWLRPPGEAAGQRAAERFQGETGLQSPVSDLVFYEFCAKEPNLTVHLDADVRGVDMDGRRIRALRARVLNAELELTIKAGLFVDASGDAIVAALAGCAWRMGREARREFGESLAPEEADMGIMGATMNFLARDTGRDAPFEPPPWAAKYEDESQLDDCARGHGTPAGGYWWIEVGAPFDTIHEYPEIKRELVRQVLGVWDHIKNHCPALKERARTWALEWVAPVPGKRESRRVEGLAMMTQKDVQTHEFLPDAVAYGGWWMDLHTPGGILARGEPPEPWIGAQRKHGPGAAEYLDAHVVPYDIPLRALVARDAENLLLAGRCISASHAALGTVRLMATGAVMGQAAGTAAAVAKARGVRPADCVKPPHITEIQQRLLRAGCFLRGVPGADEADLVRSAARATASSEALLDGLAPAAEPARSVDLKKAAAFGQCFPVPGGGARIERLAPSLSCERGEAEVRLLLRPLADLWEYRPAAAPLAETTVRLVEGEPAPVWDLGGLEIPPGTKLLRLEAESAGWVLWRCAAGMLPGCAAYVRHPAHGDLWKCVDRRALAFGVWPALPVFGAELVRSGVTRPFDGAHLWRSDARAGLPASLRIEWDAPVELDTVEITFDTNLDRLWSHTPGRFAAPECVRDYRLLAESPDGSRAEVARERGNYRGRRVHRFGAARARAIEIVAEATNGLPEARVYEVRAYREG